MFKARDEVIVKMSIDREEKRSKDGALKRWEEENFVMK